MDVPDTASEDEFELLEDSETEDEVLDDEADDEEAVAAATWASVDVDEAAIEAAEEDLGFFAGQTMAVEMADKARIII